ncbi:AMP-dependent synthetase [Actinomadura craniellae]|uniref:AMP-dependent synthetase n=1 Tax=Actinomadura craniellae TaxID=2231787 RepID=A0A365GZQ3_9ACTN|nr:AMP-dependent synthetase [Actinomadura craniellae]
MEHHSKWPTTSLPEILHERARQPRRLAFRFLEGFSPDGSATEIVDWTYHDVAEHAATVGAELRDRGLTGRRVVLALDPGPYYVAALFGIFLAGATAVPSFPPFGRRAKARFASIIEDCRPDAVIAHPRFAGTGAAPAAEPPPGMRAPDWLSLDEEFFRRAGTAPGILPEPADPALLQYTSGSTGDPKGIVLTHANLVSNCHVLEHNMGVEADRVGCSWLPPYHDMGLMGTIMLALHSGWPLVLMSPVDFVQQPYRWLRAITDNRVTISVGPNFAFDLCVDTVTDEELATLDLGSLRQVYCGAEPVFPATVERFAERFAPRGYDPAALVPCYGLAEATLFVSGKAAGAPVRTMWLDRPALEKGVVRDAEPGGEDAVEIVSCGAVAAGHEVAIADPDARRRVPPDGVGEIWVGGPNVAAGYLGRPEPSAETFTALLSTGACSAPVAGERPPTYLRTGDLGFLRDGELFVTGRIKDLIVIAGRNLYPQDIERSVLAAGAELRQAAAFSLRDATTESLVVVAEFHGIRRRTAAEVAAARDLVLAAVTADHGVRPAAVHLGPVGTIFTTTSGKVRRDATRQAFVQGTLKRFAPATDENTP